MVWERGDSRCIIITRRVASPGSGARRTNGQSAPTPHIHARTAEARPTPENNAGILSSASSRSSALTANISRRGQSITQSSAKTALQLHTTRTATWVLVLYVGRQTRRHVNVTRAMGSGAILIHKQANETEQEKYVAVCIIYAAAVVAGAAAGAAAAGALLACV